jgi:hypothetical protein
VVHAGGAAGCAATGSNRIDIQWDSGGGAAITIRFNFARRDMI